MDSSGRIWIGSAKGLICYDNGKWRRFTKTHGLREDAIGRVAVTRDNDIWIGYREPLGLSHIHYNGGKLTVDHITKDKALSDDFFAGLISAQTGDDATAIALLERVVADPRPLPDELMAKYIADGSLLRADLMLRAGQFDKSLKIYEGVRGTYDPMKAKVDAFLGSTSDPASDLERASSTRAN